MNLHNPLLVRLPADQAGLPGLWAACPRPPGRWRQVWAWVRRVWSRIRGGSHAPT